MVMQSNNVLVPCKLCRTRVHVSDLRRNKDGLYVCPGCFSHGYLASDDILNLAPSRLKKEEIKKEAEIKKSRQEERVSYYCTNCKFSFTRSPNSENKNCPYCNKEYTVQRRESASDLLRNVDDLFNG